VIDLKEVNLPMFDEPASPLMQQYQHEHTKNWSKVIDGSDGFIFVTPEYNHSIPASLKNALDYLAIEWRYKPAGLISYGANPGGARAVEHLRSVLAALWVYDMGGEQLTIPNYWNQLDNTGKFQPTEEQEKLAKGIINDVVFWAEQMKAARAKMPKGK
jgi:NAD(P)H-dependent FMN reductase